MKIALLSTPWIKTPPAGYGGIELVVSNLCEELVRRGHDVMLFATGDSKTAGRLEYTYEKAVGNNLNLKANPYFFLRHVYAFFKQVKEERFDIIHNNMQYFPMFFCDLQNNPFIHTLHGAYYENLKSPTGYIPDIRDTLARFKNHPFVSISNSQRVSLPDLNYVKTIYNGVKKLEFVLHEKKGSFLAWLGRITPNKGVDIAINVAKKTGVRLKISAFIDEGDREYFNEKIKPMIDSNIELMGEIKTPSEKNAFLGGALATLFPIRWDEPFGIVMIESMAAGTPVVAFNRGSVPEVIENGKTGFIVETEEEMIEAIKRIDEIDRTYCHTYATSTFSVDRMVDDYLEAYSLAIAQFRSQ